MYIFQLPNQTWQGPVGSLDCSCIFFKSSSDIEYSNPSLPHLQPNFYPALLNLGRIMRMQEFITRNQLDLNNPRLRLGRPIPKDISPNTDLITPKGNSTLEI